MSVRQVPLRMTRDEYRCWAEQQPKGRFELVSGEVVAMAPERIRHTRLKMRVWQLLDQAVRGAGLPCEAFGDGVTVEIGDDTDYEPDAVVNCGEKPDPEGFVAPKPVIVVEVLSPSTRSTDAGAKLADYFRLLSVQHYLMVDTRRREIIHHRRAGDRIETRIVTSGPVALDPPGIAITVEDVYRD
jgi:Uma2 family endonuclease